jgi:beta-fructofuranosidase
MSPSKTGFASAAAVLAALTGLAADVSPSDEYHRQAVAKADAAVAQARPRAEKDPLRPAYHLQAPALWMNDPNGPISFQGRYHVFYQHNPYGTEWGHMHWGHAVSRDLVHWEHWPIALAPSQDRGEEHCFSGCCVDHDGTPTILYTSIGPKTPAGDGAVQWLATSDDGLRTWRKHPANPVMTLKLHGDLKVKDWRDPFVWREGDDWFAVLGGHRDGGKGCALIYKSKNLVDWTFLNVLMEGTERNWECPNFFKLGDKWVLLYSADDKPRLAKYYTGTLTKDYKFRPEHHGVLDHSPTFYAPTTALAPDGRRLLWGWASVKGDGWNGCLTLPRVLTLRPDGRLGIEPAKEVASLWAHRIGMANPKHASLEAQNHAGDCRQIQAKARLGTAARINLSIVAKDQLLLPIADIDLANNRLRCGNFSCDIEPLSSEDGVVVRAYIDRSVLEVFVNDRACITVPVKVPPGTTGDVTLTADVPAGLELEVWELKSAEHR